MSWFQEWLGGFRERESGNGQEQGKVVDSFDTVSSHVDIVKLYEN